MVVAFVTPKPLNPNPETLGVLGSTRNAEPNSGDIQLRRLLAVIALLAVFVPPAIAVELAAIRGTYFVGSRSTSW